MARIKPGQTVYVGTARLEAVYQGETTNGLAKVMQAGRFLTVHPSKIRQQIRRQSREPQGLGSPVNIKIHGIAGQFRGIITQLKPIRARITTPDHQWQGAEVTKHDASITKATYDYQSTE
jgi:hypothetical protein